MSYRPLTDPEMAYLKRLKTSLDASWHALLITLGLVALPLAFLGLTVASSHSGDRLALVAAGVIMTGLIGAVVYYSARGQAQKKLDWRTTQRFRGLIADLASPEAIKERVALTGKQIDKKGKDPETARREYWLVAGEARYQVTAEHYMAYGTGDVIELEVARASRVVLAINGEPDRLTVGRMGGEALELGVADE